MRYIGAVCQCGAVCRVQLCHPPQGPLYFLSAIMVRQLLADSSLRRNAALTVRSAMQDADRRESGWPWEDIYVGLSLSQVATNATPGGVLGAVH